MTSPLGLKKTDKYDIRNYVSWFRESRNGWVSMPEMIKLYDASKCIACRGCQVACKQWNTLNAGQTMHTGTYQNPPALQPNTYMIIRFQDYVTPQGDVRWLFRKEACMHCTRAGCVMVCPTGTLYYNQTFGTVGINREKCIGCRGCSLACPFGVPRYDRETGKVHKCDMCETRISHNMDPACVKACPTGALKWIDKESAVKIAAARVRQLGGDANIYGDQFVGGTHLMYILKEKADVYDGIRKDPQIPLSAHLWKLLLKPFSVF